MFKVNFAIQQKLLSLPESGMGFQIVDATFSDRSLKECLILNATLAEPTYNRSVERVLGAMLKEYSEALYNSAVTSSEIIDVKLKADMGIFQMKAAKSYTESIGALDAGDSFTQKDEHFVRLSHYEDDKRIDKVAKRLLPGSFATTYEDYRFCFSNGDNPIARYALPSTLIIKFAFHIQPVERTLVKRGTVQPANDQRGGGKEAFFGNGTNNDSFTKTEQV
jgi:hypothetical protein